jgi:hypothetical protein
MSLSLSISDVYRVWEPAPCTTVKVKYDCGSIKGVYRMPNETVEWLYDERDNVRVLTGYKIKPLE